ncbi:redoxin family protein [bacterium]|nr:redoxin family protein [bacterium]
MRYILVLVMLLVAAWPENVLSQERKRCAICAVTEGAGPEAVAATTAHEGKTYYFCSEACKEKFSADPGDWAAKFEKASQTEGAGHFGRLPDFELQLGDGTTLKRSDWQNKVIVLDFWATWCGPCVAEIPQFVELQRQNAKDLHILGFSYDKQEEDHVNFLKEHGVNYPSVLASSASGKDFLRKLLKQIGSVKAIPVTILINRQGEIVYRQTGEIDEAFKAALTAELARP